jgi:hypothetical protein
MLAGLSAFEYGTMERGADMNSDWTFRWWDLAALVMALAAAVFVVQFSLGKPAPAEKFTPATLTVRVISLQPELAALFKPGDALRDLRGEPVGRILAIQRFGAAGFLNNLLQEKSDWLFTIRMEGPLRLTRDMPGFPREPGVAKAGNWCLISTDQAEMSGLIVGVQPVSRIPAGNK